jgi:hypothetical protein
VATLDPGVCGVSTCCLGLVLGGLEEQVGGEGRSGEVYRGFPSILHPLACHFGTKKKKKSFAYKCWGPR